MILLLEIVMRGADRSSERLFSVVRHVERTRREALQEVLARFDPLQPGKGVNRTTVLE